MGCRLRKDSDKSKSKRNKGNVEKNNLKLNSNIIKIFESLKMVIFQ